MPVARERSRMEAPSYPFSQKIWLACARTSASRRSNRVSLIGGAALRPFESDFVLRPCAGAPDRRVSTAATGIQETRKRPNERSNSYYEAPRPEKKTQKKKELAAKVTPKGVKKKSPQRKAGVPRKIRWS